MTITAETLKQETERLCPKGLGHYEAERLGHQRLAELQEQAHGILARARREGRTATEAEKLEVSVILEEHERFGNEPLPMAFKLDDPQNGDDSPRATGAHRFLDSSGRVVHALAPHERLADLPLPDHRRFQPLSLGRAIIGLATGNWKNARSEKLAMSEGQNAVGGYLVPEAFSKTIIDCARAKTAVIQAGGITVPWPSPSDHMTMARVAADPAFVVYGENSQIASQNLTFDAIGFTAQKLACLITLSRELAEDAPNAPALIEETIARALASELDRLALVGSGSAEPNGLVNYTGVTATDSVGAIEWQDVHNAAVAVRAANHEPTAYICSPTIGGDLDLLQASTAGTWLGAPPSVANVPRFTTTNCPDADLFIGDWSQFVFALRQDATIEVSTQAGDAFAKHQMLIKLTWRGDVGCLNSSAFHVLKGITT